jgi:membrane associated rhomboid family serine protease
LGRFPWITLTLVGALMVGAFLTEPVKEVLSLGGGLSGGKWWQAFTCHTVHFGWGHFWRDVTALALLGWLLESKSRHMLLIVLSIAACVVPATVLLVEPEILPYRGASGLVVAAYAWLTANVFMQRDAGWLARLTGLLALVALAAKILLEITEGRLMEGGLEGTVIVSWSAHFAGAMVGLLVSLFAEGVLKARNRSALKNRKGPQPEPLSGPG